MLAACDGNSWEHGCEEALGEGLARFECSKH